MNIPKLKVMPCPIFAGRHPYHEHRFIATADAVAEIDNPDADPCEQDFSMESGRIISTMTDCEGQAELATLFAAAPELIEALKDCITSEGAACFGDMENHPEWMQRRLYAVSDIARAAIAKATGGKPEAEPTLPAPEPNPLAVALRWALDSLPDDLDLDQQAAKAAATALLSGIPATPAPATQDRLPDALAALQECVDLLRNSNVRFKICDGGRGNLGEAARYHSAMNKAHAVLHPTR